MKNNFILILMMLALCSCATLSKEGATVRLIDGAEPIPAGCKSLGAVSENGLDTNMTVAQTEARFDIRHKAALMGANLVQINEESQIVFPKGWLVKGVAYSCDQPLDSANTQSESGDSDRLEKCEAKGGKMVDGNCVIDI